MKEVNLHPTYTLKGRTKILISLFMAIVLSGGFYGLDHFNRLRHAEGQLFYDISHLCHNIVIKAEWVWVYFSYFPLCFLPLLFRRVREDTEIFKRVAFGFLFQFLIAFIVFLLLPIKMVQPSFEAISLNARVLAWLHDLDKGFNVFPSLHVSNIFFVASVLGRIKGWIWGTAISLITIVVSISTILVGQHCFPDVLTGMALGILSFKVAFSEPMEHLLSKNASFYISSQLKNLWNL